MVPPSAIDVSAVEDTHVPTHVERLSVNGVPARRTKAPQKIRGGIAEYSTSDMFKGPVRNLQTP